MQPKRILISLLAVILICLTAGITVSAAETSPALNLAVSVSSETAISKSPVTVQAGDTLEVSVTVTEDPGVGSIQLEMAYDPAVLSVKKDDNKIVYENGTVFPTAAFGTSFTIREEEAGKLTIIFMNAPKAPTESGDLLISVSFTVLDCATATKGASAVTVTAPAKKTATTDFRFLDVVIANDGKAAFTAHKTLTLVEESKFDCVGGIYSCDACEEKAFADGKVPHTEKTEDRVAPKCGEVGYEAGVSCSVCGNILSGCEEIAALEHNLMDNAAKDATCVDDGWKAYQSCTNEGCTYNTKEVIKATGVHTPATADDGSTYCSVCKTTLSAAPGPNLLWLWIVLAVVGVAGVGVALYFFVFKKRAEVKHIGRPGSQK